MNLNKCLASTVGTSALFVLCIILGPALVFAHKSQTLQPGKVHEECLKINANEKLAYSFEAGARVHFNIHYHEGKEVVFAVKNNEVATEEGGFKADSQQEYCLMWTNKSKQATSLTYHFRVEKDDK